MNNAGGADWSATIPGDAASGRTMQYWIDARDVRGRSPGVERLGGEPVFDHAQRRGERWHGCRSRKIPLRPKRGGTNAKS